MTESIILARRRVTVLLVNVVQTLPEKFSGDSFGETMKSGLPASYLVFKIRQPVRGEVEILHVFGVTQRIAPSAMETEYQTKT
jgi:hypothetical protein